MKKLLTILVLFLTMGFVCAKNVLVESMSEYTTEKTEADFRAKVLEGTEFDNGFILNKDIVLNCKIVKTVDAKRGKRNAYIVVHPVSFENPDGTVQLIEDDNLEAQVVGYSKKNFVKMGFDAGLSVGSHFVKGLGQFFYFSKGLIVPDEDKSRIGTAFNNVYENSPFVFMEKGADVKIEAGDMLILKFYHSDVPKWRVIKRRE